MRNNDLRTSGPVSTIANLCKMYVGVSFISTPNSIALAGIYTSIFGFVYVITTSIFGIYLILKARNRFKNHHIYDLADLGSMLYGPWMRTTMTILIVFTNVFFLIAYIMFFGKQIDQLVCRTVKY